MRGGQVSFAIVSCHNTHQHVSLTSSFSPTQTYLCRLLAERRRLTEHGHKHIIMEGVKLCRVDVLLRGTDVLLMAIKGDAPWKAAWPKDKPQLLSALMAEAVLADCPVMAGFLHRAGAWSFARGEWGSSALSSALEAGHNHMIERLIRHLGGCIYVPDADGRLPRDMLLEAERRHLEQVSEKPSAPNGRRLTQTDANIPTIAVVNLVQKTNHYVCSHPWRGVHTTALIQVFYKITTLT